MISVSDDMKFTERSHDVMLICRIQGQLRWLPEELLQHLFDLDFNGPMKD